MSQNLAKNKSEFIGLYILRQYREWYRYRGIEHQYRISQVFLISPRPTLKPWSAWLQTRKWVYSPANLRSDRNTKRTFIQGTTKGHLLSFHAASRATSFTKKNTLQYTYEICSVLVLTTPCRFDCYFSFMWDKSNISCTISFFVRQIKCFLHFFFVVWVEAVVYTVLNICSSWDSRVLYIAHFLCPGHFTTVFDSCSTAVFPRTFSTVHTA